MELQFFILVILVILAGFEGLKFRIFAHVDVVTITDAGNVSIARTFNVSGIISAITTSSGS